MHLDPVGPSDVATDDPYTGFRYVQMFGQNGLHHMRRLRCMIRCHLSFSGVPVHQN